MADIHLAITTVNGMTAALNVPSVCTTLQMQSMAAQTCASLGSASTADTVNTLHIYTQHRTNASIQSCKDLHEWLGIYGFHARITCCTLAKKINTFTRLGSQLLHYSLRKVPVGY